MVVGCRLAVGMKCRQNGHGVACRFEGKRASMRCLVVQAGAELLLLGYSA